MKIKKGKRGLELNPGGRFFKNGCNGGMENFKKKWGVSQEWGVAFIMGGEGIFLSLFKWLAEKCQPPYFKKTPLLPTPFFKFCPTSPPNFPVTSNLHPYCSFCYG